MAARRTKIENENKIYKTFNTEGRDTSHVPYATRVKAFVVLRLFVSKWRAVCDVAP